MIVVGSSISALEIASELAMTGAERVISSARRQRYVLQKIIAGKPADHLAFTRFAAMAGAVLPMDVQGEGLKAFIVGDSGRGPAGLFATLAGVELDAETWPNQRRALLFGPLSSASYRLSGLDSVPDAAAQVEADARAFGVIVSPELTPMEAGQLAAVGSA